MKIKFLAAALIVSLLCCGVLAYLWIDRSITLSYVEQSARDEASCTKRLEGLLGAEWNGMPESVVLEKLQAEAKRHQNEEILVKKQDGAIWFDQIQFNFAQGRLRSIGNN